MRHTLPMAEPRRVQATGFDWPHEIQVALPRSYHDGDAAYPTLWVYDGSLVFDAVVSAVNWLSMSGEIEELIVVGVGAPRDETAETFLERRYYEFSGTVEPFHSGLGGEALRKLFPAYPAGGAAHFLTFMIDELRPSLGRELRMRSGDHGFFGYSGGGTLAAYAMFTRPDAFGRIICGSPYLNCSEFEVFRLEAAHADKHDDLPLKLFLGAGMDELTDPVYAAFGIVGSTTRFAETLQLRQYPSLELHVDLFPKQGHSGAIASSAIAGLLALWARPTRHDVLDIVYPTAS